MPSLPLSIVGNLETHRWGDSERDSKTARLSVDDIPMPEGFVSVLSEVAASIDKLLPQIQRDSSRQYFVWNRLQKSFQSARKAADVRVIRKTVTVNYHLGRRFVVARGKITDFIKGAERYSYHDRPDRAGYGVQRAQSWRLGRRLIRAHADFFRQLESIIRAGIPSSTDWDPNSAIACSITRLAGLECAAARALNPGGFLEVKDQVLYFSGSEESKPIQLKTHDSSYYYGFGREVHLSSPYDLIKGCTTIL